MTIVKNLTPSPQINILSPKDVNQIYVLKDKSHDFSSEVPGSLLCPAPQRSPLVSSQLVVGGAPPSSLPASLYPLVPLHQQMFIHLLPDTIPFPHTKKRATSKTINVTITIRVGRIRVWTKTHPAKRQGRLTPT